MRVDAHETFMDSSYWEQLQYTGDTRIEMLLTYAVSGDARLARQAIDAFAESDVDGGLMQGAYPSRLSNVIATFSFAWVGMLADWSLSSRTASSSCATCRACAACSRGSSRCSTNKGCWARTRSGTSSTGPARSGMTATLSLLGEPERQLPDDGDVAGRAAAGCCAGTAASAIARGRGIPRQGGQGA